MTDMNICEENRMRIDTIERSYTKALERLAQAENKLIASATRQADIVGDIANIVTALAYTPHVDRRKLLEIKKRLGTALLNIKPLVPCLCSTDGKCAACKDGD